MGHTAAGDTRTWRVPGASGPARISLAITAILPPGRVSVRARGSPVEPARVGEVRPSGHAPPHGWPAQRKRHRAPSTPARVPRYRRLPGSVLAPADIRVPLLRMRGHGRPLTLAPGRSARPVLAGRARKWLGAFAAPPAPW